jgi:alcohol dehydrogenase (cytochrome c)
LRSSTFFFAPFEEADNFSVTMKNTLKLSLVLVPLLVTMALLAQAPQPAASRPFTPVTQKMLENPSPDDWLMFSRTYDAQRYSPLKQITKQNVGQLKMVYSIDMPNGTTETIPLVHDGVMYATLPSGAVRALDAATGTTICGNDPAGP